MSKGEAPASGRRALGARARGAWDKVPTKWLATGFTAVFVLATAAVGGLADAAQDPTPVLAADQAHSVAPFTIEVTGAFVVDDLPEFAPDRPPGHRALAVTANVTNDAATPLSGSVDLLSGAGLRDAARVALPGAASVVDARPASIVRTDDGTAAPVLQPGVSVPLMWVWTVPASAVAGGDEIGIHLYGQTLITGQVVLSGQWWDDPALHGILPLPVDDLGRSTERAS